LSFAINAEAAAKSKELRTTINDQELVSLVRDSPVLVPRSPPCGLSRVWRRRLYLEDSVEELSHSLRWLLSISQGRKRRLAEHTLDYPSGRV